MIRRRLLLALLSNTGSWELFSQQYLYYTLIPQTINSKSVKNKAKISKIYGNGVIENQLVQLSNIPSTNTTNGITFTKNDDGSLTISGTASSTFDKNVCASVSLTNGHKYISITYEGSANYLKNWISGVASGETYNKGLLFTTNNNGNVSLYMTFYSGKQYNFTFYPQITDLTLREGTGNEPTTLTDNRIQNILNRGYIAFNLGEYKESDIGVVSSESKNLCEHETLTAYSYIDDYLHFNPNNAIKLKAGTYTFSCVPTTPESDVSSQLYVQAFDKDNTNNQLSISDIATYSVGEIIWNKALYTRPIFTLTLKQECYITICGKVAVGILTKPQMEIGSVATSYTPHQSFTPITFKAQLNGAINSHDTMEITSSAYVFTKNVSSYTFSGSEVFADWAGSGKSLTIKISSAKSVSSNNDIGNIVWGLNATTYTNNINSSQPEYAISMNTAHRLYIATTKTSAQLASALAGQTLYYELATPQVITIPRKHLGIVDLGSLNWAKSGNRFYVSFPNAKAPTSVSIIANIYCSNYSSDTQNNYINETHDNIVCISVGGAIGIYDNSKKNLTTEQFKNSLTQQYLYYETENEVADITDTIDIESGGTITTDSEVLPNVDLSIKCK